MSDKKIFTAEELEALGKRTVDLIDESLDTKNYEKAKMLSHRMYKEFLAMHDLYRDFVAALLTFIGRRYGDEALGEAMKESVASWIDPLSKRYAKRDTRQRLEMLSAGWRAHLQTFDIEEDEEKFTITACPCGSGGRLILEGAYGPPRNFLKIQKAQDMTFNRPNFPVYCAHCYFQNILAAEQGGKPWLVVDPAKKLGEEPCRIYLYK